MHMAAPVRVTPEQIIPYMSTAQINLIVQGAGFLTFVREAQYRSRAHDGMAIFKCVGSDFDEFDGVISDERQDFEITLKCDTERNRYDVDFIQQAD
jgi:hypothetical protein